MPREYRRHLTERHVDKIFEARYANLNRMGISPRVPKQTHVASCYRGHVAKLPNSPKVSTDTTI